MNSTGPHSTRHRLAVALICGALIAAAQTAARAGAQEPRRTLAQSLEDWFTLLEKDDVATAAKRWTPDAGAADALREHWERLKACHREYNYRAWLEKQPGANDPGARRVGDATRFTVGGHAYGHLHVVWEKGETGWRITGVWVCR